MGGGRHAGLPIANDDAQVLGKSRVRQREDAARVERAAGKHPKVGSDEGEEGGAQEAGVGRQWGLSAAGCKTGLDAFCRMKQRGYEGGEEGRTGCDDGGSGEDCCDADGGTSGGEAQGVRYGGSLRGG